MAKITLIAIPSNSDIVRLNANLERNYMNLTTMRWSKSLVVVWTTALVLYAVGSRASQEAVRPHQQSPGIASAERSITGELNASAALELLYGSYNAETKTATWRNASIPEVSSGNLELKTGQAMLVSNVATFDFSDHGKQKEVFVTNAIPDGLGGDCHACSALLGITIFVKAGSSWKIESHQPYVASIGMWGSVGDHFMWVRAGDDRYALVIDDRGHRFISADIFVPEHGKFSHVISDSATGKSDDERLTVTTRFLPAKDGAHDNVKVSFYHQMPRQPKHVENHIYQYATDKYVLIKKDLP